MIPLIVTSIRLALTPFIFMAINACQTTLATSLFAIAVFTDWLDGFLARLLQQQTALGAFLDPLADKVLFMVTLSALAHSCYTVTIPYWFFLLIIVRELSLMAGVIAIRLYQPHFVVQPFMTAKYATACLSVLVLYILLCPLLGWYQEALYSLLFAVTLYFLISSWILYAYEGYYQWYAHGS